MRTSLKKTYEMLQFPNIIGESDEMECLSMVERVAKSDSTVLYPSGTGKDTIATTIHYQGRRKDKPLIKVNCAAPCRRAL